VALDAVPEIESAMMGAGLRRGNRVGAWYVPREIGGVYGNVEVDLMVPDAVGGASSRAARLSGHAKHVARKARLEAALIGKGVKTIHALDPADRRSFSVANGSLAQRYGRRSGEWPSLFHARNAQVSDGGRRAVRLGEENTRALLDARCAMAAT
jgi:hypothetical protein